MGFYAVGSGAGDGSSNVYMFSYSSGIASFPELGESGAILWDIAVTNASGLSLYAVSNTRQLFSVHPQNGSLSYIGTTGYDLDSLEFCGGTLYGWGGTKLVTINPSNAQVTAVFSVGFLSAGDLMCSPTGVLYGIAQRAGEDDFLVQFNRTTGAAISTGITLPGDDFFGGEFDGQGQLYVSQQPGNFLPLHHIDLATGGVTQVGSYATPHGLFGLTTLPIAW